MNPNTWLKSSYSGTSSGNCLEARWSKSSYSHANGGACLEVAETPQVIKIRDTQHRDLGHLEVPVAEWGALLGAVRRGELG